MADKARAQELADKLLGRSGANGDGAAFDVLSESIKGGAFEGGDEEQDDDLDDSPEEIDEDDDLEDESEDEIDTSDEEEDEDEDDLSPDGGEDEEEDDDEEDEDDDDEEVDYADFTGDELVDVQVDGETRSVSLNELIQSYSGNGAIEKRLKEATEERKAARAERAAAVNEIENQRANLLQTVQQLDSVLFEPLVKKPSAKLRNTDIQQYLVEQDAYEEDQKRIQESREALQGALQHQTQAKAQARQQFRESEQAKLLEKLPELGDEKVAPKIQKQILDAAAHYGFTPQQVGEVDLHGVFLMALDAARWLELQNGKTTTKGKGKIPMAPTNQSPTRGKTIRKLRSSGSTAAKTKAQRSAKERQALAAKAQATGSINDVTNMLLANVKSGNAKGKRRGR